jgi:transposase InsO family protein
MRTAPPALRAPDGAAAGLHRDHAPRQSGHERKHALSRHLPAENHCAARVQAGRAAAVLAEIDSEHGDRGLTRVHAVLRGHGRHLGRSRVERLMRRAGLRGLAALPRRTRTTDSRHGYPIAPNRLGRNFTTQAPNQVWLADLTYIPTGEGWLYLATVLDLFTQEPR